MLLQAGHRTYIVGFIIIGYGAEALLPQFGRFRRASHHVEIVEIDHITAAAHCQRELFQIAVRAAAILQFRKKANITWYAAKPDVVHLTKLEYFAILWEEKDSR